MLELLNQLDGFQPNDEIKVGLQLLFEFVSPPPPPVFRVDCWNETRT